MRNCRRWRLVKKTTEHYARVFGLRLRDVKPAGTRLAGYCEEDGRVYISVRDRDGLRKSYYVLDSIAHELAHLAFFNHRSDWARLFASIIRRMADDGIFDKFRRRW